MAPRRCNCSCTVFLFTDAAKKVGFERTAAYLVRPDGHVALAMSAPDITTISTYGRAYGLAFMG